MQLLLSAQVKFSLGLFWDRLLMLEHIHLLFIYHFKTKFSSISLQFSVPVWLGLDKKRKY